MVYDCYRPQRAVDDFVAWARDASGLATNPLHHPVVPRSQLFQRGYIAARSGHSRGSTVDLTLIPAGPRQRAAAPTARLPLDPWAAGAGRQPRYGDDLRLLRRARAPGGQRHAGGGAAQPPPAEGGDGETRLRPLPAGVVALHARRRAVSEDRRSTSRSSARREPERTERRARHHQRRRIRRRPVRPRAARRARSARGRGLRTDAARRRDLGTGRQGRAEREPRRWRRWCVGRSSTATCAPCC